MAKNFLNDHFGAILVWGFSVLGAIGAALIGLLTWNLKMTFEHNGDIRAAKEQSKSLTERVERIAAILPEVRARVAREDLGMPIESLVVVKEPEQKAGKWIQKFEYRDFILGTASSYEYLLKGPDDKTAVTLVSGVASRAINKQTIYDLMQKAAASGRPIKVASDVDADGSIVIHDGPNLSKSLAAFLGNPVMVKASRPSRVDIYTALLEMPDPPEQNNTPAPDGRK
jgi:hypothetical protein